MSNDKLVDFILQQEDLEEVLKESLKSLSGIYKLLKDEKISYSTAIAVGDIISEIDTTLDSVIFFHSHVCNLCKEGDDNVKEA